MKLTLPSDLEAFVAEQVARGRYASQSEVVIEALRLLMERDRDGEARMTQLRSQIAEGLEQARRGELVAGEAVFATIRERRREQDG